MRVITLSLRARALSLSLSDSCAVDYLTLPLWHHGVFDSNIVCKYVFEHAHVLAARARARNGCCAIRSTHRCGPPWSLESRSPSQ